MALGKAVLSTTIGAEGIDGDHGTHLLLADGAGEFAKALVRCHDDPAGTQRLGMAARQRVADRYDNGRIVDDLIAFYTSLLGS